MPRHGSTASLDYWTRKLVYLLLQLSLGLTFATAWLFSRLLPRRRPAGPVASIAALWYWPPDYPAASHTRLGVWKSWFEAEGIRFDNFHVGSMAELTREFEAGSWSCRYWFYLKTLWRRWRQFFALRGYDVVWIDRWFWPHYPLRQPLFERLLRRMVPRMVVDSSDGSDFVANPDLVLGVMGLADRVTVAYRGLQEFYRPRFASVERFEYPIIEDGYRARTGHAAPPVFTLGWMGSPTNFRYLEQIAGQLSLVAVQRRFRLVVICRQPVRLEIPGVAVFRHGYGKDYFELIAGFDIGLVPFTVVDFSTTGKIGMKHQELLLCAVPQVCSPVGISEHAIDGEHVLLARRMEDWAPALLRLMADEQLRSRIGNQGRELCRRHYTAAAQWPAVRKALTRFDTTQGDQPEADGQSRPRLA